MLKSECRSRLFLQLSLSILSDSFWLVVVGRISGCIAAHCSGSRYNRVRLFSAVDKATGAQKGSKNKANPSHVLARFPTIGASFLVFISTVPTSRRHPPSRRPWLPTTRARSPAHSPAPSIPASLSDCSISRRPGCPSRRSTRAPLHRPVICQICKSCRSRSGSIQRNASSLRRRPNVSRSGGSSRKRAEVMSSLFLRLTVADHLTRRECRR